MGDNLNIDYEPLNSVSPANNKSSDTVQTGQAQSTGCTYEELCPNGGTHTCQGSDEGQGCHYNPSINPACTACPSPEAEMQCDDIYYPDPNTDTGCVHKFSTTAYPNCNYFAPPVESYVVDSSFCQQ